VTGNYEVYVSREDFKFNAAHFMAYPGFRERLHGHNYRVAVRIEGELGEDGYVLDFGEIKSAAKSICGQLNERTLIPTASDCIRISHRAGQIDLFCEDGTRFSLPEGDCVLLPIRHSSAEELAAYICDRLLNALAALRQRKLVRIEVSVAEAPYQEARFCADVLDPR